MKIKTRDGKFEDLSMDKVLDRLKALSSGLSVDCDALALTVVGSLVDGMKTSKIDELSALEAHNILDNPDYETLASRLIVNCLHKNTPDSFSVAMKKFSDATGRLDPFYLDFITDNAAILDSAINNDADFTYSFSALFYNLIRKKYLLRLLDEDGEDDEDANNDSIIERPQYMFMRVAIGTSVRKDAPADQNVQSVLEAYGCMMRKEYIHGTPTMQNACLNNQQLCSCFLLGVDDDSKAIMKNLKHSALISKNSGGMGIHFSAIRCNGSKIKSSGGKSAGICPQLSMYNESMNLWNQGGKRKGALSIYLEEWHGDVIRWVGLKNKTKNSMTAADLFYSLWCSDLFLRRCKNNQSYTLFSPDTAPGLNQIYDGMDVCRKCGWCHNKGYRHVYGTILKGSALFVPAVAEAAEEPRDCKHAFVMIDSFSEVYGYYEQLGRGVKTIDATELLDIVIRMKKETGGPFHCFKDTANRCSMQNHVDTLKSSNLCTEIFQISDADNYASCTLGSMSLPAFVTPDEITGKKFVDIQRYMKSVRVFTRRLDNIIDLNNYPVKQCLDYAKKFRSIAIGIQGLHKTFIELGLPYDSPAAERLEYQITECRYFAALEESAQLAKERGPFDQWQTSYISAGILHQDLWLRNQQYLGNSDAQVHFSGLCDWDSLKADISNHGIRNNHLIAEPPTVSTSAIYDNSESFEPYSQHIGTVDSLKGRYISVTPGFINALWADGLWTEAIKRKIINNKGMIGDIPELHKFHSLYQTVWELKQKSLLRRAANRAAFIDQGQSLNVFMENATMGKLKNLFIDSHKFGLKTGSYYTRTRAATGAMDIAVTAALSPTLEINIQQNLVCSRTDGCTSCSG